jgi:hypothetical protein
MLVLKDCYIQMDGRQPEKQGITWVLATPYSSNLDASNDFIFCGQTIPEAAKLPGPSQ